jgi:hypothetical protein
MHSYGTTETGIAELENKETSKNMFSYHRLCPITVVIKDAGTIRVCAILFILLYEDKNWLLKTDSTNQYSHVSVLSWFRGQ